MPNEDHQRKSHSTRNSNVRNLSSSSQQHLHQPYLTTSVAPKSRQLHQNLDKLRSEINEFKESLNKSELPGEESKENTDCVTTSTTNNDNDQHHHSTNLSLAITTTMTVTKDNSMNMYNPSKSSPYSQILVLISVIKI